MGQFIHNLLTMGFMAKRGPRVHNKMKELVLHVATASVDDPKFGATKLNKILFYADFLSYLRRGKSISGQKYFALEEGPAPKCMFPLGREMISERSALLQNFDSGMTHPTKRWIALRAPNYEALSSEDVAIVDFVIAKLRSMSNGEVSHLSHKFKGWRAAYAKGVKTEIPFSAVLADPSGFLDIEVPELPDDQVRRGKAIWKRLNQVAA